MKQTLLKPAMAVSVFLISIVICEVFAKPLFGVRHSFEYFAFNYAPFLILSLLLFALTNRSVFSTLVSGIFAIALVSVNNIKYSVLGKPLIPSDFLLTRYFFESPDLYMKYINVTSSLCVILAILSIVFFYRIEKKQLARTGKVVILRVAVAAVALTFFTSIDNADSFVAKSYSKNSLRYSSWDPRSSVNSSGLFYTFIRLSEQLDFSIPDHFGDPSLIKRAAGAASDAQAPDKRPVALPDIVVVQSESFYDLRQHALQFDGAAYADYDRTAQKAAVSGNLGVPTVGGNTVKTEFSFLTGIESTILPSGCEYPYRSLVRRNIWSIAWYLKTLGYATVAIHPYSRTFWDRNIALQFLGFDEFIDGSLFTVGQKEGLYVSDQAVADRIAAVRKEAKTPLFIFAITMENHGPWDKKRVASRRKFRIQGEIDAKDRKKVGRYLHHVVNAGEMAFDMTRQMKKSNRPCVLAFYGDHAPGLGETLDKVRLRPGRSLTDTPYFIWKNFGAAAHVSRNLDVSFLASEILDQAGINNDVYFSANSYMKSANKGVFDAIDQSRELSKSYTQLMFDNLLGKLTDVEFHSKKML